MKYLADHPYDIAFIMAFCILTFLVVDGMDIKHHKLVRLRRIRKLKKKKL